MVRRPSGRRLARSRVLSGALPGRDAAAIRASSGIGARLLRCRMRARHGVDSGAFRCRSGARCNAELALVPVSEHPDRVRSRGTSRRTHGSRSSVLSFIKCRLTTLQLHAGVVRGELPVDLGPDSVSGRLPRRDLVAQDLERGNAAIEALTDHDVEFDFSDVEPTAVLGRIDELEAVP